MEIFIRKEKATDHHAVFDVIAKAFKEEALSDQQEPYLVERLRRSKAFIPELSIVALFEEKIIAHILLSKIIIKQGNKTHISLALAPVSVLPQYQSMGIGSRLIKEAHIKAKALGYTSIVLVGHAAYYPRFGYLQAASFGIRFPFEVPIENGFVKELVKDALQGVSGMVEYPKEFFQRSEGSKGK